MTENEKRARLNEIGKEIAEMHPKQNGSIEFDYADGELKGLRRHDKWRPTKTE